MSPLDRALAFKDFRHRLLDYAHRLGYDTLPSTSLFDPSIRPEILALQVTSNRLLVGDVKLSSDPVHSRSDAAGYATALLLRLKELNGSGQVAGVVVILATDSPDSAEYWCNEFYRATTAVEFLNTYGMPINFEPTYRESVWFVWGSTDSLFQLPR